MGNFAEFLFGFDDQFWHEFNLATDTSQIQDFENFLQKCVYNEAPQVPIIYWVRNQTLSGSLKLRHLTVAELFCSASLQESGMGWLFKGLKKSV